MDGHAVLTARGTECVFDDTFVQTTSQPLLLLPVRNLGTRGRAVLPIPRRRRSLSVDHLTRTSHATSSSGSEYGSVVSLVPASLPYPVLPTDGTL